MTLIIYKPRREWKKLLERYKLSFISKLFLFPFFFKWWCEDDIKFLCATHILFLSFISYHSLSIFPYHYIQSIIQFERYYNESLFGVKITFHFQNFRAFLIQKNSNNFDFSKKLPPILSWKIKTGKTFLLFSFHRNLN